MKLTRWYYVLIVFGIFVVYQWRSRRSQSAAEEYARGEQESATAAAIAAAKASERGGGMATVLNQIAKEGGWGGIDLDPTHVKKADQTCYPGWYLTGDGGMFHPDSGAWYSPGSSPPCMANAYDRGEATRVHIDGTGGHENLPSAEQIAETRALGYDVVY